MRTLELVSVSALLCVSILSPFLASQTGVSPEGIPIPMGQYTTLSFIPVPPPFPSDFEAFYNVGWEVDGTVNGSPINIYVFDYSNYENFESYQQYSVFQELDSINGSFKMRVVFPSNGPFGTYIFLGFNITYSWWMVFDNRAGSSNATLYIGSQGQFGSVFFLSFPIFDHLWFAACVLLLIGLCVFKSKALKSSRSGSLRK